MASFGGHALPGALLIILSLLLTVEGVLIYFTRRPQFRGASFIIVALATIGIMVELFWPVHPNEPPFGRLIKPGTDQWNKPMNWQHSTMYTFFFIYGAARLAASSAVVLSDIDRLAGALAFGVEGYLFYNHVHGRGPLDTKIHLLIAFICLGTALIFALSFFLEQRRKTFMMGMIIAALVFAQGTWFWHVAFILYGPKPWIIDTHKHIMKRQHDNDMNHSMEENHMDAEHMDAMFAVLFFTWHVAFALFVIFVISFTIHKFLKKRDLLLTHPFDEECHEPLISRSCTISPNL